MGKRPKDSVIWQQQFEGLRPTLTIKKSVLSLVALATLLVGVGGAILGSANGISQAGLHEASKRYDDVNCDNPKDCYVTLSVDNDMESPVYLYYEMRNFYHNHIVFVKSRDYPQLRGVHRKKSQLLNCEDITTMSDIPEALWPPHTSLTEDDIAKPCGLASRYFPSEFFQIHSGDRRMVDIDQSDIAWESDRDYVYEVDGELKDYWLDVEDGEG